MKPNYRTAKGLVFFRLRDRVVPKDLVKGGRVVVPKGVLKGAFHHRIQDAAADPPLAAVEWSDRSDGPWSRDFGGQWFERGDGRIEWRWN